MTTEQRQLSAIVLGALLLALPTFTWFGGYHRGYNEGFDDAEALPHQPDTVYRTKTVTIEKPVEVVKWKEREKPVYVPVVRDSLVHVHDTAFVEVPREYRLFSGEGYKAQVSGIDPSLDWLQLTQRTATITKRKRWSWGVSAGPGIVWDGREVKPGAAVIIGGQFNF